MKTIYRKYAIQHRATKILIAITVAFALAFTVVPCTAFCTECQAVEPTLPASDMVDYMDDGSGENGDGDMSGGNTDGNTDGKTDEEYSENTSDSSQETIENTSANTTESSSTTKATTSATKTTTRTTTKATTTINTSNKKWNVPKGNKTLSLTICRNSDGSGFDLTAQAGQKLYAYDTLQGAAAGKGYGYFALYNRKNNHAKIVKVRLSSMKVVKVSAALDIRHANDLTYNNKNNTIVVANGDPTPKRITVINASTLKIKYHKTLKMPRKVSGMSKKQRKKFKGIGAIAYNGKHNCYVCRMRKTNELLFLNSKFKPYKRIRQNARISGMLYQGMDSYKDCIMICQSFKGKKKYNVITIYNMKGKKIARFTMAKGKPALELETVFHNGNQFYAGFYSAYGAKDDLQKLHIKRNNPIFRINNL